MKGAPILYSGEELAWLEANCTLPFQEYARAFVETFGRTDVSATNLSALRKRKGWHTGRTGRFEKGAVPINKGKPCQPGQGGRHPNAQRTQFKPGNRTGRANDMYKPIGTERISKEGYREIKLNDGLPMHKRWRMLHLVEWEARHGPIPKGMVLKCIGDKLNTDPSNWQLVPRAILPRLNGGAHGQHIAYDTAPEALKPAILTVAKLAHAARSNREGR